MGDKSSLRPSTQSVRVKRSTKIFNMHTYWSKKPHSALKDLVAFFTDSNDVVLDPFSGSGGLILVAGLLGRAALGLDLSPAATFLSATLCAPPALSSFKYTFHLIMQDLRQSFGWLYTLEWQKKRYEIHYGISSMIFKCSSCGEQTPYYRTVRQKQKAFCPSCGSHVKTTQEKLGYQLDEWHFRLGRGQHLVVHGEDMDAGQENQVITRIQAELSQHPPPTHVFPPKGRTQVLGVRGIQSLTDLYTPRNLLALCLYRDKCLQVADPRLRHALLYVLTACCLKASRMMGYNSDKIGRVQKNGLIAQLIVKDVHVFDFLEIAFKGILAGYKDIVGQAPEVMQVMFSTQSATSLDTIPSGSIGYIFCDPPYGERVQFWESNQVWEAWLGFDTHWDNQEIVVNHGRGKNEDSWEQLLRQVIQECYRVLQPGRWLTLTYNDRTTYPRILALLTQAGFQSAPTGPSFLETTAKSEKQLRPEDNPSQDLVLHFLKPLERPHEEL